MPFFFSSHPSLMSESELILALGKNKRQSVRRGVSVLASFPRVTLREDGSKRINWNWQV